MRFFPTGAPLARTVRLWGGLTLFTYVLFHLVNHALGLISLGAMERGLTWALLLWRSPPGMVLLIGALISHLGLGLWALYRRRTLRMPAREAVQLVLGLAIPAILLSHIAGTRITDAMLGTSPSYTRVLLFLWVFDPLAGGRQVLLLLIAWIHGCLGLHFWLRFRRWYPRVALGCFAAALLIPVLALLGFAAGAREAAALVAKNPALTRDLMRTPRPVTPAERARPAELHRAMLATYGMALVAVLAARVVRDRLRRRRGIIRVSYPERRDVQVPLGWTVLEASRFGRVPHASACGGRGRCSTCRIRVLGDLGAAPEASAAERRVLERVSAPPNVRLACQLRPTRDIAVVPLLPASLTAPAAALQVGARHGQEREIAVLFADLRGFTRLAEHRLPYDVVFFLNRYFEAVGGAVTEAGGIVNQFTGDGVMALFGVDKGAAAGCRQALVAAAAMVERVRELSQTLGDELESPLRIGIGIHSGPTVVGGMGYGQAFYLTAVGDTVHVAARLEALTKEYQCELVISDIVASRAGVSPTELAHHELTLRNRQAPLGVLVVNDARRLAARLAGAGDTVSASP